jgi:hypothetical protein
MSTLVALKLTAVKRPTALAPIVQRRNKLLNRLWEQLQLAAAQQQGETFSTKRYKTVRSIDGSSKSVQIEKRVRQWWFVSDSGKLCLNIKYGSKVLELQKGKSSIEISTPVDLIPTLELVKRATEAGELDAQIELASGAVRARFVK